MKTEAQHQAEVVRWFDRTFPQYRGLFYHNFNNPRNKIQGAQLIAQGLRKGMPDLSLALPRGGYGHLYLEMKKPGEHPRKDQLKQMARLKDAGNCVKWADSADAAKEVILNYLYLDQEAGANN